jgi:membrane protein
MLLLTIDRVFNQIWGVRRPRPLLARLTTYWFVLTVGPLALGGSILATGHIVAKSVAMAGADVWLGDISARIVPLFLFGGLFTFLYYAVPNHPVRWLHAIAGGIAAAVLFLVMQRVFGLFIARFPTYTLVYGTFAALPIFLVWLYLSWVVVLLGALLAAMLPSFFERKRIAAPFPGDRARIALHMLIALAEAQRTGVALEFDALQRRAQVSSADGESVLGEMREAGWVACTESGEWLLSRGATEIRTTEVIARFALSPVKWLAAEDSDKARRVAERLEGAFAEADLAIADLIPDDNSPDAQIG